MSGWLGIKDVNCDEEEKESVLRLIFTALFWSTRKIPKRDKRVSKPVKFCRVLTSKVIQVCVEGTIELPTWNYLELLQCKIAGIALLVPKGTTSKFIILLNNFLTYGLYRLGRTQSTTTDTTIILSLHSSIFLHDNFFFTTSP